MSDRELDLDTADLWKLPVGLYPYDKAVALGMNLRLQVKSAAGRSWILRHKGRWHGIGSLKDTPPRKALQKAGALLLRIADGDDPIEDRKQERAAEKAAATPTKIKTFKQIAEEYLRVNDSKWSNAKHRWQWGQTLQRAYDAFGDKDIAAVNRQDVIALLKPIWCEIPETARRLRARIETVCAFAEAHDLRPEDSNPARQRPVTMALGDQGPRAVVKPRPSLPHARMAEFMADLRTRKTASAEVLELLILTATRGRETVAAEWREINWNTKLWTIPLARLKVKGKKKGKGRDHVVPLSPAALTLLTKLSERRDGDLIFGVTVEAVEKLIKTMNAERAKAGLPRYVDPEQGGRPIVPHGFRSSFRTWCFECRPDVPREIAEMALAHTVGSDVERAYQRSDGRDLRRELMTDWAAYCTGIDPRQ